MNKPPLTFYTRMGGLTPHDFFKVRTDAEWFAHIMGVVVGLNTWEFEALPDVGTRQWFVVGIFEGKMVGYLSSNQPMLKQYLAETGYDHEEERIRNDYG